MKRLIWTISVAFAGVFLTARSAPVHWEWVSLGAIIGGVIGFGFGSIFTAKNIRLVIVYWGVTFAIVGSVLGLEEPFAVSSLLQRAACGAAIGTTLGLISYLLQARKSRQ
jgi:hypothetical protein